MKGLFRISTEAEKKAHRRRVIRRFRSAYARIPYLKEVRTYVVCGEFD